MPDTHQKKTRGELAKRQLLEAACEIFGKMGLMAPQLARLRKLRSKISRLLLTILALKKGYISLLHSILPI